MAYFTSWQMRHRQQFFQPLVAPGALVFDIGANMGEFTAAFLSVGAARVVAVEPQRDLCIHLARCFAQSIVENKVVVQPVAVSSKPGRMRLNISSDEGGKMSTLSADFVEMARRNGHGWDPAAAVDVPVTTLAALIAEFGSPDFVKIDVEGHDLEVLRGLDRALPLLSFEYNTDAGLIGLASACIDRLGALGDYEFNFQAEARDMVYLQLERWVSADVMKFILGCDVGRSPLYGDVYCRLRGQAAA